MVNFKGWDYCELAAAWEIPCGYELTDKDIDIHWKLLDVDLGCFICEDYDFIRYLLESSLRIHYSRLGYPKKCRSLIKLAKDLRAFLSKLGTAEGDYYAPMWSGMATIESDESLVKVFIPLIGYAWN